MPRIRITGARQGEHQQSDGTYAVGLQTKWGYVWLSKRSLPYFLQKNKHLQNAFADGIEVTNLIGRYVHVQEKECQRWINNQIFYAPRL